MKRLIAVAALSALLSGCANDMQACGETFTPTGVLTMREEVPGVKMKVVVGNVIWGVVLFGSVIAPIYFFGFSLWEPVSADCAKVHADAVP